MSALLNLDPSAELNVAGIWTGHSFEFTLEFYNNDNTPLAVPGTPVLKIYSGSQPSTSAVMTLTIGDGLTIESTNKLRVKRSKTENTLTANSYYFTINDDIDASDSFQSVYGTIQVKRSR